MTEGEGKKKEKRKQLANLFRWPYCFLCVFRKKKEKGGVRFHVYQGGMGVLA